MATRECARFSDVRDAKLECDWVVFVFFSFLVAIRSATINSVKLPIALAIETEIVNPNPFICGHFQDVAVVVIFVAFGGQRILDHIFLSGVLIILK